MIALPVESKLIMHKIFYLLKILLLVAITSACNSPSDNNSPPDNPDSSLNVEEFTTDELFAHGSGGCGMSLWKTASNPSQSMIFFNGMEPKTMLMKINGELVKFERTNYAGEEFYGQFKEQTFINSDEDWRVDVKVELGEPGEIESIAIEKGGIKVKQDQQEVTIPVVGDAGC